MTNIEKTANAARMACADIGPRQDWQAHAICMKTDWRRVVRAAIAQILNRGAA